MRKTKQLKATEAAKTIPMPEPWKENFRSSTLTTRFVLALTQPMLEFLCAVADDVQWDRAIFPHLCRPDNWVASENALEKRGLVRRKSRADAAAAFYRATAKGTQEGLGQYCELTPAGVKLVELLRVVGLFIESDAAIEKRSRRRGRA